MPVFTDLDKRVCQPPFDEKQFKQRLVSARRLAKRIHLVHVSGKGVMPFHIMLSENPHELPTSADENYYTDNTRNAEDLLGLPRSVYFYAGRAHPRFGNVALAFAPDCERSHAGSATPFDTGGLFYQPPPEAGCAIRLRLEPDDDETTRAKYGKASVISLDAWRELFARVLAAYFDADLHYWTRGPSRPDPEDLYQLNHDWRAWVFEIRFVEPQAILERVAWSCDGNAWNALRRLHDDQPPTPLGDPPTVLERFLNEAPALEPCGSPTFYNSIEQWVRERAGV